MRCLTFLALLFPLWIATSNLYTLALASALDRLLPLIESPWLSQSVLERGGDIVVSTRLGTEHAYAGNFHFGTVIFVALVLATLPNLSVAMRALVIGAGLLVLFPIQLFEIHFLNQTLYSWQLSPTSYKDPWPRIYNETAKVFKHGETAFPIALWVFAYFGLRFRGASTPAKAENP